MTDLTINPYTRQPYSEFATRYLACDRCGEAKVREGDGDTVCEECASILASNDIEDALAQRVLEAQP
jgi:hypothetical protein